MARTSDLMMQTALLAASLLLATQVSSTPEASSAQAEQRGGPRAGPVATQALYDEILAADGALFAAAFDTCDTARLASIVTDDFEMFHDKGGLIATSGKQFVENFEGTCARQKTGEDYRARR